MSRARTLADTVSTGSAVSATANDLSGGVTGAVPYQTGVGDTAMLSPGTSGQVLTTQGSGSPPAWGNVSSAFDTSAFSFTNYPKANFLSAGSRVVLNLTLQAIVPLGTTHLLFIVSGTTSTPSTIIAGIVYDIAGNTFGSWTQIRDFGASATAAIRASAISSSQVLICSVGQSTTALETVVLSISGTTITVNTAVATTLSANFLGFSSSPNNTLITVGSSYVIGYGKSGAGYFTRAITVSGTTPTLGSELSTSAVSGSLLFPYSATQFINVPYQQSSSANFQVIEISSGTTQTKTSDITLIASPNCSGFVSMGQFASGRIALTAALQGSPYTFLGFVVSITAGVATASSVNFGPGDGANGGPLRLDIVGNQAICSFSVAPNNSNGTFSYFWLLTDNAGTAVSSTYQISTLGGVVYGFDTSTNRLIVPGVSTRPGYALGISGNQLGIVASYPFLTSVTNTYAPQGATFSSYPFSGSKQFMRPELISASGKLSSLSNWASPYAATFKDGVGFTPTFNATQGFGNFLRSDPLNAAVAWSVSASSGNEWIIQRTTLL